MNSFVKYYGDKKPADAANVVFQMSEVYEKQKKNEELAKHLDAYLKKWGAKGGIDKQILAHFKLGELAWTKSCPQEGVNGACIKVERVTMNGKAKAIYVINKGIKDKKKKLKEKLRTQCGPPTSSKITVYDRTRRRMPRRPRSTSPRCSSCGPRATPRRSWQSQVPNAGEAAARAVFMRFAVAGAAFYQAEQVYEQFLKVKFPAGLDFQQPTQCDSKKVAEAKKKKYEDSSKKFMVYLTEKTKLAERLAGSEQGQEGHVRLRARLPRGPLDHRGLGAHRPGLRRLRQPALHGGDPEGPRRSRTSGATARARSSATPWSTRPSPSSPRPSTGYDLCLKAATKESWFNEWSTMCEVELNQMKPAEYPLAAEAKPEPGYVSTPITPAAVVSELPDDVQVITKE